MTTQRTAAALHLEKVTKVYRKGENEVRALDGIDIDIEKGEFLAVVGPSGSGKTTFLNILGCLDSPSGGRIVYDGTELRGLGEKGMSAYRRERISFVFQSYNLIPVLTVRENVELPLLIERKLDAREIRRRAEEMIAAVGLAGKENRYPRELSGGQEQRVAIARALVKAAAGDPRRRAHREPRFPYGAGDHRPHARHQRRTGEHLRFLHARPPGHGARAPRGDDPRRPPDRGRAERSA